MEAFDRISTPQKILILLLVMLTIGVAFYFLLYSDLEDGIKTAGTDRARLLSEETEIRRRVANQEDLEAELEQLRSEKQRIEKVLPAEAEIPKLLQKIYGQAKIVGLQIRRFEPGDEVAKPLYIEIPVAMELQGDYDQVADFFFNIGKMERVVNIKNISMHRTSGGQYGQGELIVSCQAITYRAGLPGGTGAGPAEENSNGKQGVKMIESLYKGTNAIKK